MPRHELTGRPETPRVDSAPAIGLAWLVRLRWGLTGAVLVVAQASDAFFGTRVDWRWVFGVVALSAATNLGLRAWSKRDASESRLLLAVVLVLDGVLLTLALRASGGAMNPFSALYIVHVALAALLLDGRATWIVAGTTCLGFAALYIETNSHAGHHHHHGGDGFDTHLRGMLAAYALAAAFVGYFVYRVARALERREREMSALRDRTSRAEKVASLTTLAAGAAHELGTPLATIAVVAKELEHIAQASNGVVDREALVSDARLVREEAERCHRIIAKMATDSGEALGTAPRRTAVGDILERVRRSIDERRGAELVVRTLERSAFVDVPEEALVQVLVTLVTNGFDASTREPNEPVELRAETSERGVTFSVEDRGKGIATDVLAHLGEPFFSTKRDGGMGLGLFLARSFAERVGGALSVETEVGVGTTFVLDVPGGAA